MRTRFVGLLSALILGLAFGVAPLAAQQSTLSGTVRDSETLQPVAGASVQVIGGGTTLNATTNNSGVYRVQVPSGTYAVVVEQISYVTYREDRVSISGNTTLDVSLTSTAFELGGIVVTTGRKAEKKTEAPATTHTVSQTEIAERPAVTPVEHIRTAPGVDIITQGVQATNVVVRGFNNIFSGGLHALTDNRIAGIPSLRVNLLHFIPQTNEDIERMEVVLGPGSALYGPNTANGVLHMITRSPLDHQGTTVTFGGGEQSVLRGSLWTSHLINEDFGVKISGQYARGNEWPYVNAEEQAARAFAEADPDAFVAALTARGAPEPVAQLALSRVGTRINEFERFSGNLRADYRVADDGVWTFDYGVTSASGIELTGLGAGQTDDWIYQYFQTRLNLGRLFMQTYLNTSDSGDSYLINDGMPLVDESRLFVAQAQYGFDLADGVEDITFGFDYFRTNPRTSGTINGANEDIDDIDEFGAYIQSETAITSKLDLVLAGRIDSHSFLEDDVFSPRAALVFKPDDNSSFRVSYNRAFSPPSTLNLFLDISGGAIPNESLAALGYRLRAQGPNAGFSFQNADGSLKGMRSPFTPGQLGGPSQLLPANTATLWQLGFGVLNAQGAFAQLPAPIVQALAQLQPTAADIGINVLDPNTGSVLPLAATTVPDVGTLEESTNQTFEIGYQGVINNNFLLAADVWYSERENFVSPLVVRTPFLLLNGLPEAGPNIANYLVPILIQNGLPEATAIATATAVAQGMAQIPLATVSSNDVNASGADVLATYVNAGTVKLWGADLSMKWFVDDRWTLAGTYSWVEDDYFADAATAEAFGLTEDLEDGLAPIALNAPKNKGTLTVGYRDAAAGLNLEGRFRFNAEFPAESAGFVGTECITGGNGGALETECVDSSALFDVTMGYKIPNSALTFQLTANNVFDAEYRSFVGVPNIGRMLMAQLKWDLR